MAATCVRNIDSPGLLLSPSVSRLVKEVATRAADKEDEETNKNTDPLYYRLGICFSFIITIFNIDVAQIEQYSVLLIFHDIATLLDYLDLIT